MNGMSLSAKVPVGVITKLQGEPIDFLKIVDDSVQNGSIATVKLVNFQFRYSLIKFDCGRDLYFSLYKYLPSFSDANDLGKFAGILIAKHYMVPVLPISGSLPNADIEKERKLAMIL